MFAMLTRSFPATTTTRVLILYARTVHQVNLHLASSLLLKTTRNHNLCMFSFGREVNTVKYGELENRE